MIKKNEMTIKEIYDSLNLMGFEVTLENLAKMKPTELKRFYKKAKKAFESCYSVQRVVSRLSLDEENSAPIPRDE